MTAAASLPRKMTLEEWAQLDEDESGELVDGYLVEEEKPSFVHEAVVGCLIEVLRVWLISRGGFVAGSGVKIKVSARSGRMADQIEVRSLALERQLEPEE